MQSYWLRGKATSANQYLCLFTLTYQTVIVYFVTTQLQMCCRYWLDGEPNVDDNDACVAVYGKENIFKSWRDAECDDRNKKWICEKAQDNWG